MAKHLRCLLNLRARLQGASFVRKGTGLVRSMLGTPSTPQAAAAAAEPAGPSSSASAVLRARLLAAGTRGRQPLARRRSLSRAAGKARGMHCPVYCR